MTFRADQYGTGSADTLVELATLEHPAWEDPIRVVNHPREGFTLTRTVDLEEQVFIAYPFSLVWPDRNPDQPFSGARFMINNVLATDGTDEPLVLAALFVVTWTRAMESPAPEGGRPARG